MATTGPEASVTDDEIMAAIKRLKKPYATVSMLQNHVDLSDQRLRERLATLEAQSKIKRDKVGQTWIHWLPEDPYSRSR